jgi:dolichyl-phosphate-mannose-protein mannosyltransferase
MNKLIYKQAILTFIICVLFPASIFCADNLVKNPGMEKGSGMVPDNWETWEYFKGSASFATETNGAHEGTRAVSITCNSENDARLVQKIPVKENTYYKISAWIKTENVRNDVIGANISVSDRMIVSRDIKGTTDRWEKVDWYVLTAAGVKEIMLSIGLGWYGNTSSGKAYFDDLSNRLKPNARILQGEAIGQHLRSTWELLLQQL